MRFEIPSRFWRRLARITPADVAYYSRQAALPALYVCAGIVGVFALALVTQPIWDFKHHRWQVDPVPGARSPQLSIFAQSSSLLDKSGRSYKPMLRISCVGGRPNVMMSPLRYDYCVGDCSKTGGVMAFFEEFITHPEAHGTVFQAQAASPQPLYADDTLSNPPDTLVQTPKSPIGLGQSGNWYIAPGGEEATRFRYPADTSVNLTEYFQARNFIERLASSKVFKVVASGEAEFDTHDLREKLGQLWAACPLPAAPAPPAYVPPVETPPVPAASGPAAASAPASQ